MVGYCYYDATILYEMAHLQSWQKVVKAATHRDCQFTTVHHTPANTSATPLSHILQPDSTENYTLYYHIANLDGETR